MSTDSVPPAAAVRGVSLLALIGFVLGVLSLALTCVTGIPAIILGIVAIRRINHTTPPPRGQRLAFTGIITGIVGCVLAVVGLVAVFLTNAIDKSRRAECTDNLRQIGRAIELHHQDNDKTYPPGSYFAQGRFQPFDDPRQRLSWLVTLLPYLDRPDVASAQGDEETGEQPRRLKPMGLTTLSQKFVFDRPWDAPAHQEAINTPVRLFVCPSHPHLDREQKPAPNHYAGSAGLGADAPELTSLEHPRAGFLGYNRVLRRDRPPRGTSNTLVCGETTSQNGPWAACGPATLRGVVAEDVPLVGFERAFGGCHRGGANLLMLDGRVMFFNERGNPEALTLLIPLQEPLP